MTVSISYFRRGRICVIHLPVNDLFAATENWPSADFADYCHFTEAANRRLGKLVADFLRKQL